MNIYSLTIKMKQTIANLLIWLYNKLIWRAPCVLYARTYDYTKWLKDRETGFNNTCPFCLDKLEDNDFMLYQFKHRFIIPNQYPYPRTKNHLLLCPYKHIRAYNELSQEEFVELQNILSIFLDKDFYLLGRQFWNASSSVNHLHLHLIQNE